MTNEAPVTPPGWYVAGAADQLRWWDGQQWTQHVASVNVPAVVPAASAEPPVDIETRTTASWLLTLMPLTAVLIVGGLALADVPAFALWVTSSLALSLVAPVGIGLALWDLSSLRTRGSTLSMANSLWMLLGAWLYLVIRAAQVNSTDRERWVLVVVNLVLSTMAAAALLVPLYYVAIDQDVRRALVYSEAYTERQIAREVFRDTDQRVDVDCPAEPPVGRGETFECSLTDSATGDRVGTAVVTWDNDFGYFSWTTTSGSGGAGVAA